MAEFEGNVATAHAAPCWDQRPGGVERSFGKGDKVAYYLRKGGVPGSVAAANQPVTYAMRKDFWYSPAEDRTRSKKERQAYVAKCRSKAIAAEEETRWRRWASNAGYH